MIVDTSALFAFFDAKDPHHAAVASLLMAADEPLIVSPYVIAELDYLVMTRIGVVAELKVLRELAGGAWDLADVPLEVLQRAAAIVADYADDKVGVTDAVNVALAERHRTLRIATLDRRHFGVLRHAGGEVLQIVS